MGKKRYAGNLPYDTTDNDRGHLFEAHGIVQSAQAIKDREPLSRANRRMSTRCGLRTAPFSFSTERDWTRKSSDFKGCTRSYEEGRSTGTGCVRLCHGDGSCHGEKERTTVAENNETPCRSRHSDEENDVVAEQVDFQAAHRLSPFSFPVQAYPAWASGCGDGGGNECKTSPRAQADCRPDRQLQ